MGMNCQAKAPSPRWASGGVSCHNHRAPGGPGSAALGTYLAAVAEAQWPLRSVAGRPLEATRAVATVRLKIQEHWQ